MPITIEMMKAAARAGMSIVCASCERYWEARDKGIPGDQCASDKGCGSPLAGDYFHDYRGIMTTDAFRRFCFVCGEDATHRLDHPNWVRKIGVCREHVVWLKDPEMRRPKRSAATPLGSSDDALPPDNTLLGAILKTEKEWADQDGREFDKNEIMGELGLRTEGSDVQDADDS
jgi:hypothetical protein